MGKITRAISIRQPYVELILRRRKKIEYRSVATNMRERVYLYASLAPSDDEGAWEDVGCGPDDLPRGLIVGTVEIVDCRKSRPLRGYYEYVLARPKRLAKSLRAMNQPQPRFWIPRFR